MWAITRTSRRYELPKGIYVDVTLYLGYTSAEWAMPAWIEDPKEAIHFVTREDARCMLSILLDDDNRIPLFDRPWTNGYSVEEVACT